MFALSRKVVPVCGSSTKRFLSLPYSNCVHNTLATWHLKETEITTKQAGAPKCSRHMTELFVDSCCSKLPAGNLEPRYLFGTSPSLLALRQPSAAGKELICQHRRLIVTASVDRANAKAIRLACGLKLPNMRNGSTWPISSASGTGHCVVEPPLILRTREHKVR